jgi:hypothetical protein
METREFRVHHQHFRFKSTEDIQLVALVRLHGISCWQRIADEMPERNPRQCRDRWNHYLAKRMLTKWYEVNSKPSVPAVQGGSLEPSPMLSREIDPEMRKCGRILDSDQPLQSQNAPGAGTDTRDPAPNSKPNLGRGGPQIKWGHTETAPSDEIDLFSLRAEYIELFAALW